MNLRKIVWSFVALFALFVLAARWPISIPCQQCGGHVQNQMLLGRVVEEFDDRYLHFECVDEWCVEHPIRLDENGSIINPEKNWKSPLRRWIGI